MEPQLKTKGGVLGGGGSVCSPDGFGAKCGGEWVYIATKGGQAGQSGWVGGARGRRPCPQPATGRPGNACNLYTQLLRWHGDTAVDAAADIFIDDGAATVPPERKGSQR
jgi:hypothetical protein